MSSNDDNTPALTPPPGQETNFDHPSESLQPTIIATYTVCLTVSTLALLARASAQFYLVKRFIWADSWASHVTFAAMILACLPYGAGFHQWDVRKPAYLKIEFYLYVSFVLYDFAIVGAKVSILLQLNKLFAPRGRNWFWWTSVFLILANVIFYVVLSFALIFQCRPLAKAWDPSLSGTCVNQDALLTSSGPFNIVSDFLMFILPLVGIWKLKISLKRRLGVISTFTVALFGCICSSVRVWYSHRLSESGDGTWLIMQNQMWANAEITVGILIASVFILPRFVRHVRDRSNSSRHYQYYGQRYGPNSGNGNAINRADVPSLKSGDDPRFASSKSGFGKRAIRDLYTELVETDKGPKRDAAHNDQTTLVSANGLNDDLHTTDIRSGSSAASATEEGVIMRTVDIETNVERIELPASPTFVAARNGRL